MASIHNLRMFVNERLSAVAEEIFSAVERTILELQNTGCLDNGAHKQCAAMLTLASGAMQDDTVSPASEAVEVKFSSTLVSSGSDLPEPQDQRSSPDHQQRLGDCAVSFRPDQNRDGDLYPSTSAENWVKTDEEGEEGEEVFQPLCLDSEAENDSGDTELSESGPGYSKSKKKRRKRGAEVSMSDRTDEDLFDCVLCGHAFHGENALKEHMESHLSTASNYELPPQRYTDDNLCYLCGKTFSTRSHLKRHLLVHTGQKPHCCQECGKRFSRRESLRVHMRVHSVEKPYTCEVCGRGFKQRSNMVCHVRTHTGVKPHTCAFCSKSFTLKKDMLRHMEAHSMKS